MVNDPFDLALVQVSARLRSYFARRIRDSNTVEDLTQETLLKALRARDNLRDFHRIETWIYRIAHCTAVDFYRRKRPVCEVSDHLPGEHSAAGRDVRQILAASARCYLGTLPPAYRVPVELAEYEGLPHGEVARRLGLTLSATKARVRRGKIMVRGLMEAQCEFQYDVLGNVISYQLRPVPLRPAAR
ncbi:MAG TPA: sigma-70 family RNA polymerase sigma factor [Chthoniobacterales bacterium]|nr:sigma-70 family RNA polymerase sigma factor [Chthoniobacterales bacterium]